jgi:hypothetical protein
MAAMAKKNFDCHDHDGDRHHDDSGPRDFEPRIAGCGFRRLRIPGE